MKKLIFCSVIMSFSFIQIKAEVRVLDKLKDKTSQAWLSTKATAAYVACTVREPNSIKIQRALEAKEAVLKIDKLLQLNLNSEDILLQNVQALGFNKHNGLSALTMAERYSSDLSSVVRRYNSKIARWNRSEDMEAIAQEVLPALELCKKIKLYFQEHKQCLIAWEIIDRYKSIVEAWQQNDKLSVEVKSADVFRSDVERIKSFIVKKSFRLVYPQAYKQLHEYLPILECKLDKIDETA